LKSDIVHRKNQREENIKSNNDFSQIAIHFAIVFYNYRGTSLMASEEAKNVLDTLQTANKIMEDLIDLALGDQTISPEEQELLFSINSNLQHYVKLTIEAVSDNIVTDEEKQKLMSVGEKIIEEAEKVAMKDSEVSDDEKQLLESLISSIKDLNPQ
jgi:hypothetical protein